MREILKLISETMEGLGIAYEFGRYSGEPEYPYFVGEYTQTPPTDEDGLQEASFILTGTTRGTWLELEQCRERIEQAFDPFEGMKAITDAGSGIAVYYADAFPVPTDTDELKRIQVDLEIKKWRAY